MSINIKQTGTNPNTGVTSYCCNTDMQFLLVGARGVGKTSLVASMTCQILDMGLAGYFHALGDTADDLTGLLDRMSGGLNLSLKNFDGIKGIAKSADIHTFNFELSGQSPKDAQKRFYFPVQIVDLPGLWYTDEAVKRKAEIKDLLRRSRVSFICINAPSPMEGDDNCFKLFNRPATVSGWYYDNDFLNELKALGHKVMFVLSRCEKYRNQRELMREKLQNCTAYKGLINAMLKVGLPVELTYVHTLGGVEFERFELVKDKQLREKYKITGTYEPENCDTPLMRALAHANNCIREKLKSENARFWQKVKNVFGASQLDRAQEALDNIITELSKEAELSDYKYWDLKQK